MSHFLAILLSLAGFVALALSMTRHQRDLAGRTLAKERALAARYIGGLLLTAAFVLDIGAFGGGYGTVAWCAHLSIGAWLTVALLQWRKA
ncbi:DUF3325 domain-containing protein [Novosphingobium sp. BL-8A]|uniref:DUF3325 domain-containing protein n=1 Tax=Novosphingobium sp. BL-8A TaxID=3127639 RepID=UPI003757135C